MSGHIARRRPDQPPLPEYDRLLVRRRLRANLTYRRLSSMEQHVLDVAVLEFMGGHGYWWHSRKLWAEAAGCSTKTITRATDNLETLGLITKEIYHRPPGASHRLNGTKIYRLNPAILGEKLLAVPATRSSTRRDRRSPHAEHATHGGTESPLVDDAGTDTKSPRNEAERQRQEVPTELDLGNYSGNNGNSSPGGAREPGEITALLEGIPLHGPGRKKLLAAWLVDPDRVDACVDRWWDRPNAGAGLLVRMVEDGDDPRLERMPDTDDDTGMSDPDYDTEIPF
jgi:hypothetical protein